MLIKTSRPRFWLYVLGPFLLGLTGGLKDVFTSPFAPLLTLVWGLWFTFPANLIIYGINDLFDEETDKANAKKSGYETRVDPRARPRLKAAIWLSLAIGLILWLASFGLAPTATPWITLGLIGFLFFGHQYSATPIRAKARPFLDSAFNILYVFPAFVGWGLSGVHASFPWLLALAGALWCMAMHAFSAIPDIEADRSAKLSTVATLLGREKTLAFCAVLYGAACLLTIPWLQTFSLIGLAIYGGMMAQAWRLRNDAEAFFRIYKRFPLLNMAVGFGLWLLKVVG